MATKRRIHGGVFAGLLVASCGGGSLGQGGGSATVPLSELLARTWIYSGVSGGDCTRISTWDTFGADGSLSERDIDDNQCYGPRLLNTFTGAYTLRERVLEMTLNGLDAVPLLRVYGLGTYELGEPSVKRVERFPIMIGKVAGSSLSAGLDAIDGRVYTSTDGVHDQSQRYARLEAAAGTRLFEREMTYQMTVDPPLPLAADRPCTVTIDFSLVLFEPGAPVTEERGTFHLTYDAITRVTDEGWMRLMPRALDGLPDEQIYPTWQALLDQAGLSTNHSERFARTFGVNFSYSFGYPTDDPKVLAETLPGLGRWIEPTTQPPIW